MNRLAARRARVARSVDRALAERVRVLPVRKGGATIGGPDPDNPPYEVVGVFTEAPALGRVVGRGGNRGEQLEARGARHSVSFALGALGPHPHPLSGWHVQLIERDGQPTYRVTPGTEGPPSRLTFDLVPLG